MNAASMPPRHDLNHLRIDDRSRRPGRSRKGIMLFLITLAAVAVAGSLIVAWRAQPPVVEVATVRPAVDAASQAILNASGYVTPRRRATVAAKVTGLVQQVYAEEGLQVTQGQVLAVLDCAQPDAALASAKSDRDAVAAAAQDLEVQRANAERELRRTRQLAANGIYSQQALDAAQMADDSLVSKIALVREQTRAAEAKVAVAQQDVENCTVRSPFAGKVVSKDAQRGEMVSPVSAGGGFTRTGIATIVDMTSLEIEVDVNESFIARVKPGQKTMATLDAYPDWQIPSSVRTVIPTADRQKATVKVRVVFDRLDPKILPDMGVKVAFLTDQPPPGTAREARAMIPRSAVESASGHATVYVVNHQQLERRAVTLGSEHGDNVEITAGLKPGETLVAHGLEGLRDGQRVAIKP